ncbi:hypothetical protein [Egicoccus sp. AB-alg2]|uniref:hypothetical protein n=1 Tax=Egicoccus sp. AB-alg2 TaxID=3242693 RepID=UPI00359E234A
MSDTVAPDPVSTNQSAASSLKPDRTLTVLDVFASSLAPVGPNMSNASTPPQNTDFDDQ